MALDQPVHLPGRVGTLSSIFFVIRFNLCSLFIVFGHRAPSATKPQPPAVQQQHHVQHTHQQQSNPPATSNATSSGSSMMKDIVSGASQIAIGHTMGRALSNMFGLTGGSSGDVPVLQQQQETQQNNNILMNCEVDNARFMDCMQAKNDDLTACQVYYDLLKACRDKMSGLDKNHTFGMESSSYSNSNTPSFRTF